MSKNNTNLYQEPERVSRRGGVRPQAQSNIDNPNSSDDVIGAGHRYGNVGLGRRESDSVAGLINDANYPDAAEKKNKKGSGVNLAANETHFHPHYGVESEETSTGKKHIEEPTGAAKVAGIKTSGYEDRSAPSPESNYRGIRITGAANIRSMTGPSVDFNNDFSKNRTR